MGKSLVENLIQERLSQVGNRMGSAPISKGNFVPSTAGEATAESSSECSLGKEGWDGVSHKSISLFVQNSSLEETGAIYSPQGQQDCGDSAGAGKNW